MSARIHAPHRVRRRIIVIIVGAVALAASFPHPDVIVACGFVALLLTCGLAFEALARGRVLRRYRVAAARARAGDWVMRLDGTSFEALCAEVLRGHGAQVVQQGGSGDQGADLIVDWGGRRYVVQCKRYKRNVSNAAVQQAYSALGYHRADGAVVMTNAGFTRSARDLAERTGVRLIDGDGLRLMAADARR